MEEAVALYDRIGAGYDGMRRADPEIVARLAARLDLRGEPGCLDVGCGVRRPRLVVFTSAPEHAFVIADR